MGRLPRDRLEGALNIEGLSPRAEAHQQSHRTHTQLLPMPAQATSNAATREERGEARRKKRASQGGPRSRLPQISVHNGIFRLYIVLNLF